MRYTVTDLGSLGNFTATAKGISGNGLIVGAANSTQSGYDFAVRWGGTPQVLTGEGASGATANAVNSSGVIVGMTDSLALNGYVIDGSGIHNLGTMGGFGSAGCDINDAGLIVGFVTAQSQFSHAATWRLVNGAYVMTPLPELGGFSSVARAVNAQGVIAGEVDLPPAQMGAPCIWTVAGVQPLGIETSSFGEALGINDLNQVVGYSYTNTGETAFLWSAETGEVNLGTLGNAYSTARAINNRTEIVGQSYVAGTSAVQHAFIWKNGVMTDLNTQIAPGSGWVLWDAQDINDAGRIVGGGLLNGHAHAFMLTPVACAADIGSAGGVAGSDGTLDNNDFVVFIDAFFSMSPMADVGSVGGVAGGDGAWDNNDFVVFVDWYFAGC